MQNSLSAIRQTPHLNKRNPGMRYSLFSTYPPRSITAHFFLGLLTSAGIAATATADTQMTLINPGFEASGNNTNPSGWTTTEPAGSSAYIYGSTSNVLAFWGDGAQVQQSFSTEEATADSFGTYSIIFDSGWRNNAGDHDDLTLTIEIINVTEGTVLGSTNYVFPPNTPSEESNVYRVIKTGNITTISYDSSGSHLKDDEIALRITASSPDGYSTTGWVDNISIIARQADAHWSLDGSTLAERLTASYGNTALNLQEIGGSASWDTRTGFGNVLANGSTNPYLSASRGHLPDPGEGDFTLSLWAKRTSDNGTAAGLLDAIAWTGTGYQLFFQSNGTLRLRVDDDLGNTVNADTTNSHVGLNTWQNIIVSIDRANSRARFYINGSEVAPLGGVDISSLTGAITPDQDLYIGTLNGTNPSQAQLDDIAIFNRRLAPEEIAAIGGADAPPLFDLYPGLLPLTSVKISPDAGSVSPGTGITITTDAGAPIHYTLDGSEPDENSSLYAGPIILNTSATLTARVVDGTRLGPISSRSFAVISNPQPNILMIIADDLGFNDLGCYGAVSVVTPNLDQLAYSGQRFTQYTTTGPGDLNNQYAWLTGRVARRGGLPATAAPSSNTLDTREWTLAEALRKSGYQTSFIGAWHLGSATGSHPNEQGFTLFNGLPWSIDQAPPLQENEQTITASPAPATLLEQLTARAEAAIASAAGAGNAPFFLVFQPPSLPAIGNSLLGDYGNRVEALDASVGRLITQLDSSGLRQDTLVIFLSDGGAATNTRGPSIGSNGQLRDGKGTTWEGGVHVPMIASWPGTIPVDDNYAVVWTPDLFQSLVRLTQSYQPANHQIDGTDRNDVIFGVRTRPDEATVAYMYGHNGSAFELTAMRQGPWKYHLSVSNLDSNNNFSGEAPLLFDLLVDPTEHVNRSNEASARISTMEELKNEHQNSLPPEGQPQLPAARPKVLGPIETTIEADGHTTFIFTRPADTLNDHYLLQVSNELKHWSDIAIDPYTQVTAGPDQTETLTLTVSLPALANGQNKIFARLKAVRP
ncbi:sulfatase-like hydrolase/transferase [Verrucomicrobiaceae bacterium N1E253]|uniref:Sulfatase-like hydrolase/transferase n=1 Tax=Oceaniferula marina TaxID=2748318 RepID=A0A851G9Q4_9BACT|nr:sulfatase-like hydrolase/transferase [Oceaniferula marina]NWK54448.1 sulfatase-like hydrolase/transferase [Oceaniferula marina]